MTFVKQPFAGLRSQMAIYGHSQKDLAAEMGVTPNYIYNRINAIIKWSLDDMLTICKIYNKSIEELFVD